MTTILFMLACAAAEGFLLYVLTRLARALKEGRTVRSATAVTPVSCATNERTLAGRELGRVIEITSGSRVPSRTGRQSMAS
jgi:hypothetical protein